MALDSSRGILYVASGEKFQNEAIISARSIKAVWPNVPLAIITDHPIDVDIFDVVQIGSMQGNNIDKVRHISLSPFQRTILLDTDTYCLHPFPEIFDLLDHFQIAAPMDNGRFSERWDPSAKTHVFIHPDGLPDVFRAVDYRRYIRQPHRRAVPVGQNQTGVVLARKQLIVGADLVGLVRAVEISLGLIYICGGDRTADIFQVEPIGCQLRGIDADPHRRLLSAADAHQAHA